MPAYRRNYIDIYNDGKKRLRNNAGITAFGPESIAGSLLEMLSLESEKIYDNIEYISNAVDPTKAGGSELDKIGGLVGETRGAATVASDFTDTNFYFYIDPKLDWNLKDLIYNNYSPEEIKNLSDLGYIEMETGDVKYLIIPHGTRILNTDGSITYTTVNDCKVANDSANAYSAIVSESTGPMYNVDTNVLVRHSLTDILELRRIAQFIKCTNTFPISNGRYTLNDEELRYNISTAKIAAPTNDIAIRRAALSVPGIRDVVFQNGRYGNGTISVLIDGVSPIMSEGLIAAVKERLDQVSSNGDIVFVNRPTYVGVELRVGIIFKPGVTDQVTIKNKIRAQVIQYINDLPIGGEIIWNKIVSIIVSVEEVKDFTVSYFKLGSYDIINKLNKNQIVLRTTNQKARVYEKFYTDTGLLTICNA